MGGPAFGECGGCMVVCIHPPHPLPPPCLQRNTHPHTTHTQEQTRHTHPPAWPCPALQPWQNPLPSRPSPLRAEPGGRWRVGAWPCRGSRPRCGGRLVCCVVLCCVMLWYGMVGGCRCRVCVFVCISLCVCVCRMLVYLLTHRQPDQTPSPPHARTRPSHVALALLSRHRRNVGCVDHRHVHIVRG
jgi:hypothetical protein